MLNVNFYGGFWEERNEETYSGELWEKVSEKKFNIPVTCTKFLNVLTFIRV